MTKEELMQVGREALCDKWGVTYGQLGGHPFGIVDSWDSVHGLWTELVHAAGLYDVYKAAVEFAKDKPYTSCRPYKLTSGEEVLLVTDERLGGNGLFPGDDKPPYLVPPAVEEAGISEVFEALLCGAELDELDKDCGWGFSDEYAMCDGECGTVLRTSPDSYGWTPNYFEDREAGERFCPECTDAEEVLTYCVNKNRALPRFLDLAANGLVALDDLTYESGLHPGQNDDPKDLIEVLKAQGIDVWLSLLPGQFDVAFWPVVRAGDEVRARAALSAAKE
jgi:hypothetical protein